MRQIDWLYHRPGCRTCGRLQEFLARHKITTKSVHDARKQPLPPEHVLAWLGDVDVLYVARGKQMLRFDLSKQKPNPQELKPLLAGPTGNLRAPTIRVGRALIVGFEEATCRQILGL